MVVYLSAYTNLVSKPDFKYLLTSIIPIRKIFRFGIRFNKMEHRKNTIPAEFFLAMSSALDVLRCSILRFGILNGGTCMLSELI